MKALAGALMLAAAILPRPAAAAPDDLIVRYQMLFGGIHIADVEDRLVFSEDSTYRFSSNATAIGIAALLGSGDVARTSSGRIDEKARRLEVDRYFHKRKDAEQISEIDRGQSLINISYKGSASSVAFESGKEIADPMTLNYLFYAFPERADAPAIEVLFTDGKRGKPYLYRRAADFEPISIPAGEFAAVRFDREDGEHSNSVWFIPELGMIPGRILIVADAKIEFLLVRAEPPADADSAAP